MQGITSKFSLKDFVAYLFPGLTWLLAIIAMLSINDTVRGNIKSIDPEIVPSLIFLFGIPITYFLGAIASSIGSLLEELGYPQLPKKI